MIVIEGSWWPLVVVGQAAAADTPPSSAVLMDEHCLEFTDDLHIALVVAGAGAAAVKAYNDLLAWLLRVERRLDQRTCRLAWVIEDDDCRACTDAWLRLSPRPLFDAPAASFRTMSDAIRWLLQATDYRRRVPERPSVSSLRFRR